MDEDAWVLIRKAPLTGGGVKGAALSTEKQDINLEEVISW